MLFHNNLHDSVCANDGTDEEESIKQLTRISDTVALAFNDVNSFPIKVGNIPKNIYICM